MKKTILISALLFSVSFASAATFQYSGLQGKLSNLTEAPNSKLEIIAEICRWDGFFRKCSNKSTQSKVAQDGSFKLIPMKVKYNSSHTIIVKHFLNDKSTNQVYELTQKQRSRNLSYTKMNFSFVDIPAVEAELNMEDGRTFSEWLSSEDRPNQTLYYQISSLDPILGEYVPLYFQTLSDYNLGKRGRVEMKSGRTVLKTFITNGGSQKFLLEAFTHGKTEGSFPRLLKKEIELSSDLLGLEQEIISAKLSKRDLNYDISGKYETVFMAKGYSYLSENSFRGPEALKVIRTATFKCSQNIATAEITFPNLGVISVSGRCDKNGKAQFRVDQVLSSADGLGISIHGELLVTSTMNGEMYARIQLDNGQEFAKYHLYQSYYPRVWVKRD